MNDLINNLKEQTQDLKAEYIKQTAIWAAEQVVRNIERKEAYYKLDRGNIEENKARRARGEGSTPISDKYWKEQKWVYTAHRRMFDAELYVPFAEKGAEVHYTNTIEKLALRLVKKGLDSTKAVVTNASIDSNLECQVTDGEVTVRCWTIIASGQVQRPHYRYLIK